MSEVKKEIVSLVQDKYLFRNFSASVNKWDPEILAKVYQRLLSVYDNNFDYSSSCLEAKLHHVQKCVRLLGFGFLAARIEDLTDTNKALRIISAIDDKISSKHTVQEAARRARIIMKKEAVQSRPLKKVNNNQLNENLEQENVDPNTFSKKLDEPAIKALVSLPTSGFPITQDEWLHQQNNPTEQQEDNIVTIIPTGYQLPRTPVRPTDSPLEESDSAETSKDEENTLHIKNDEDNPSENDPLNNVTDEAKINCIPSGRQLPRTPMGDGDLNISDEQQMCTKNTTLSLESQHFVSNKNVKMCEEKSDSSKDKKAVTNRRGTFVLPKPSQSQITARQKSSSDNVEKGDMQTVLPSASIRKEDSYSDIEETIGSFTLPPPEEYAEESCSNFKQPNRRGTFTVPPPIEYKEEARRGTFTVPSTMEYRGDDRRGTFTIPPPDGDRDENLSNDSREDKLDIGDSFILSPPIGYGKDSSDKFADRRGTYEFSSGRNSCDSSHTDSYQYVESNTNRRGTFVLPPPLEMGNKRETYVISGPSDMKDKRGTYNLGKASCISDNILGVVCQDQTKNQVLVFHQESPNDQRKPRGPIPDMSEFDDLPFTDEISASDITANDGTFVLDPKMCAGNSVVKCDHISPSNESPLPVNIIKKDNITAVNPQTSKENYIPRGKQIPRTPNNPTEESVEESTSLMSTTANTSGVSIQIFVKEKISKSPQGGKCLITNIVKAEFIDNPVSDPHNDIYQVKKGCKANLSINAKLEPEDKNNVDGNSTCIQETAAHNDVDCKTEEKSANYLINSCRLEMSSELEFNDSLEIFPSKSGKMNTHSELANQKAGIKVEGNSVKNDKAKISTSDNNENRSQDDNDKLLINIDEAVSAKNEVINKNKHISLEKKEKSSSRKEVAGKKKEEIKYSEDEFKTNSEKHERPSRKCIEKSNETSIEMEGNRKQKEKMPEEDNEKSNNFETDLASLLGTSLDDSDQIFLHSVKKTKQLADEEDGENTEDPGITKVSLESKKEANMPKEKKIRQKKPIVESVVSKKGKRKEKVAPEVLVANTTKAEKQEFSNLQEENEIKVKKSKSSQVLPKRGRKKKNNQEKEDINGELDEDPLSTKKPNEGFTPPKQENRKKNEEDEDNAIKHSSNDISEVSVLPIQGRRKDTTKVLDVVKEDEVNPSTQSIGEVSSGISAPPKRGRNKKTEFEVMKVIVKDGEKAKRSSCNESLEVSSPPKRGRRIKKNEPELKVGGKDSASEEVLNKRRGRRNIKNEPEKEIPAEEEKGMLKVLDKELPKLATPPKIEKRKKNATKTLKIIENKSKINPLGPIHTPESPKISNQTKHGKQKVKVNEESLEQIEDCQKLSIAERHDREKTPPKRGRPKKTVSVLESNLEEPLPIQRKSRKNTLTAQDVSHEPKLRSRKINRQDETVPSKAKERRKHLEDIEQVEEMGNTEIADIAPRLGVKSKKHSNRESSKTQKSRGKKNEDKFDKSSEEDLAKQEKKETRPSKRSNPNKKIVETTVSCQEEIPAAVGRESRRAKMKASAAIKEALNNTDS